jgi:hypothetical protein
MTLLAGEEFFDLFRTFEHTAFRLEVRESYYEKEQLAQFLAGEQVDLSYMEEWLALMSQHRQEGKRIERVRVVSRPYSDYTRYGLWLCQYNTQAGEDIRYLERQHAAGLPSRRPAAWLPGCGAMRSRPCSRHRASPRRPAWPRPRQTPAAAANPPSWKPSRSWPHTSRAGTPPTSAAG